MAKRNRPGSSSGDTTDMMADRDWSEKEPYIGDGGIQSLEGKAELDKTYGTGRYLQDSEIDREFRENFADRNFTGKDNAIPGVMRNPDIESDIRTPQKFDLEDTDLDAEGDVRSLNDRHAPGVEGLGWGHDGDESRYASARYKRSDDLWHEDEYETDRPGRH